jgi:hypothetical protein
LSPFLDGSNPSSLLIPNDLLTTNTRFDGVAAVPLTVTDDPVTLATLLNSADTATFPIPQHLFSDIILDGTDPTALGVSSDQISAMASLDGFGPTPLGIADHVFLSQSR